MALKFVQHGSERLKNLIGITTMIQNCKAPHHWNISGQIGKQNPCISIRRSINSYSSTSLCYSCNFSVNDNNPTKGNKQHRFSYHKDLLKPNLVLQLTKRNAGHSHWHNIRHTKAARDGIKSQNGKYIYHKMKNAVREGGNITDPKLNSRLAGVIEEGRKLSVPNAKMQEYIKKMTKNQGAESIYHFEGKGPGTILLIFRIATDTLKSTRDKIKGIYRRHGGMLGDKPVTSSYAFHFKGMIFVSKSDISDMEAAMEIAIESEAEEVNEVTGHNGDPQYQFICDGKDLYQVLGKIRKQNVTVEDYYEIYIPKELVTVNQDTQDLLEQFYIKLDNELQDYVEKVYDNIKVEE